jgi:hypothetical protein
MEIIVPVLFLTAFVALTATICAVFCALVGGCLAYQYGIKLRDYKPRGFLIGDINSGVYKLIQRQDGDYEVVVNNPEEDAAVEDPAMDEEAFNQWMFGTTSKRR